jgi:ligand-binding SRPBCC domain-containing protein
MTRQVQFEQWVPAALEQVFLFFANPRNLPRIMPPETETELVELRLVPPSGGPAHIAHRDALAGIGSEIVTSFRVAPFLPFRAQWIAEITEFEWNHHFADVQEKGPFKRFHHRHELLEETRNEINGSVVRDVIEYDVGFGWIGELAQKFFVKANVCLSAKDAGEGVETGSGHVGTGVPARPRW